MPNAPWILDLAIRGPIDMDRVKTLSDIEARAAEVQRLAMQLMVAELVKGRPSPVAVPADIAIDAQEPSKGGP